jgi:gliding motility-associated protein GldL
MHWYESYQGKKVVGCVYSLGASIVIVGALFKIMHFPGAGPMLIAGMSIEAILFAIGCLDKPHAEHHWENVFPQLLGYGADPELIKELENRPRPTLLDNGSSSNAATKTNVPALSEKELESLKNGIADLAKTATQLSELGNVATATNKLVVKLDAAGEAAEQFVEAGKIVGEKSDALADTYAQATADMKKIAVETKAFENQVSDISAKLNSLNAVYELQLKALQSQADAYNAQTLKVTEATAHVENMVAGIKSMTEQTNEALKTQEAYVAGSKQLANQVADLNKVYGNMLNALS